LAPIAASFNGADLAFPHELCWRQPTVAALGKLKHLDSIATRNRNWQGAISYEIACRSGERNRECAVEQRGKIFGEIIVDFGDYMPRVIQFLFDEIGTPMRCVGGIFRVHKDVRFERAK
jgi:hypothetical protein